MNEQAILDGLKTLIRANEATLVQGLTHQGQPRAIAVLSTSIFTPPTAYYWVALECSTVPETSRSGQFITVEMPPRSVFYNAEIHCADYLIGVAGEEELFETMHNDFRTFCDRVSKLVSDAHWIPDATSNPRVRLTRSRDAGADRRIEKTNTNMGWQEAEQYHALAYAQLRFTVVDENTDDTLLYP